MGEMSLDRAGVTAVSKMPSRKSLSLQSLVVLVRLQQMSLVQLVHLLAILLVFCRALKNAQMRRDW